MTRQQGAVLVVSLSILVVLTLLGMTAVASGVLQQKMTSNFTQYTLAFEAAEIALEGVVYESNDPLRYAGAEDPLSEARMGPALDRQGHRRLSCSDKDWINRSVTGDGLAAGIKLDGQQPLSESPKTDAWSRTAFYRETACLGSSTVMGRARISCHHFITRGCGRVAEGPIITANTMSLSVMAPGSN